MKNNLKGLKKIKIYNYGVGKFDGNRTLYYSKSASAEGSFLKDNMNQNYLRRDVVKTRVDIIKLTKNSLRKLKIPQRVDLVKIDVEGVELEVLESLKELNFKYLYIEVSVKRKGSTLNEISDLIKKRLGRTPKLLYYYLPEKNSPAANALISLENR